MIFRVRLQVDLLDYFLQNFKFLFRFVHVNQFEHNVFRNELFPELACENGRTQLSNEFVLEIFFDEKVKNGVEQELCLANTKTKLNGNLNCYVFDFKL